MNVKQLFDYDTWTYTYLLWDTETKHAAIIDSVYEQAARDSTLIRELGLDLQYILDTHVHADHITGASELKSQFPNAKTVLSVHSGTTCADMLVDEGTNLAVGTETVSVLSTPGHTNGCISFVTDGKVFTGDSLFIRGCGRTDFQQGDAETLYDSVVNKLFTLSEDTVVYPGHNYSGILESTIGEEKKYNPRFLGKNKDAFLKIMHDLDLPYPKKIKESVPANLQCGVKELSSLSISA